MFLFILFILLLLVAGALFAFGKGSLKNQRGDDTPYNYRKFALIPLVLAFLFLGFDCYQTVSPGQVGIPVTFGTAGAPLGPGFHLVSPFTDVTSLSIKTQEYTMAANATDGAKGGNDAIQVLGLDGAEGQVDVTVLFHVDEQQASNVYRKLGTNYVQQVVRPTVRNCVVDAYKKYNVIDDATTQRGDVETIAADCIKTGVDGVTDGIAGRGFVLESLDIRNTTFSKAVQDSLNNKVSSTNGVLQAQQDAEKVRIEAEATADSQQIIKCGSHAIKTTDNASGQQVVPNTGADCVNQLTPEYLQWWYTKMLDDTSKSPNHDTVIIPSGQSVTPLVTTGK